MRILILAEKEVHFRSLPPKPGNILEAILYLGELPRGELAGLLGSTARHARRSGAALADHVTVVIPGATPIIQPWADGGGCVDAGVCRSRAGCGDQPSTVGLVASMWADTT